ncbi:MAG: hypothetical protein H6560_16115 [Lewinellaceae bacterium]|nr:hypothetical protein [Lewinellaceae bacterium]
MDPNTPGTYSFFAECVCDNGCPSARTEATFTVLAAPPPAVSNYAICQDPNLAALPDGEGLEASCGPAAITDLLAGPTLPRNSGGTGSAYDNPDLDLYYSVRAGSSTYNINTYASDGTLLNTAVAGFDYRSLWWNPNTGELQGNLSARRLCCS